MATNFVQRMMIEHSELVERIKQLNDYVYSKASDEDLKFLLQNFLNGGQKNEFGTVVTYE